MATTDNATVAGQLGLKPTTWSEQDKWMHMLKASFIGLMIGTGLLGTSLFILLQLTLTQMDKETFVLASVFGAGCFACGLLATIASTAIFTVYLKKLVG